MPKGRPSVLISGGGVAGPALAYWLARRGYAPVIVERAPGLRGAGYRIEISSTGTGVLDRMGVLERVRAEGGGPPSAELVAGPRDRCFSAPPVGRDAVVIRRDRLGRILYDRAADDAEYLFDDTVAALHQDPGGVDVEFEGRAPRRFDLVVGADGLHSAVRRLVFGGGTADHTRFLGTNLAIFTVPNRFGMRDAMRFHVWPYRGCMITTFPGNAEAEGLFLIRSRRPLDMRGMSGEERRRFLERVYAGDGWEVPGLLRDMRGTDLHFAPSLQVRMDSWSRGRVVLLGDAAYCPDPMTGQGSVMALLGAVALAGELDAAGGDHARAFPAYEAAVRPHAEEAQDMGRRSTGFIAPRTGRTGVRLREWAAGAVLAGVRGAARLGVPLGPAPEPGAGFPLDRYAAARG
ncbi:FAD-dependent monooxygenase [Nocardiopsis potens]|uniref:FAD-dependent monooxygenase n=1 Tax=Nocardiopsis potens TaxID=1246458 RepID=UPI001267CD4F|nr:FAD-dependent monooxygenase [Nocardiopsis potens]